jgi:hypothetical protein
MTSLIDCGILLFNLRPPWFEAEDLLVEAELLPLFVLSLFAPLLEAHDTAVKTARRQTQTKRTFFILQLHIIIYVSIRKHLCKKRLRFFTVLIPAAVKQQDIP